MTTTDSKGQIQPRNGGTGNGALAKRDDSLAGMLERMLPQIAKALPRHITPERMTRIAATALRTTPHLDKCSAPSFLGCVMSCAQLGIEPNTPLGQAYLIPRRNKQGGYDCTLIVGYRGMIDLAWRSGMMLDIQAQAVYAADRFEYAMGLEPQLSHVPSTAPDRKAQKLTHVYAIARLKGGGTVWCVLSRGEVDEHAKASASRGSGPWATHYEAMARKTAIRELAKYLPQSADRALETAVGLDEARGSDFAQAIDPSIQDALIAQGVDVTDVDDDSGEVPADREPGAEG